MSRKKDNVEYCLWLPSFMYQIYLLLTTRVGNAHNECGLYPIHLCSVIHERRQESCTCVSTINVSVVLTVRRSGLELTALARGCSHQLMTCWPWAIMLPSSKGSSGGPSLSHLDATITIDVAGFHARKRLVLLSWCTAPLNLKLVPLASSTARRGWYNDTL